MSKVHGNARGEQRMQERRARLYALFDSGKLIDEATAITGLSRQTVKERFEDWQLEKIKGRQTEAVKEPVEKPRRFCCSGAVFSHSTNKKSIWMD